MITASRALCLLLPTLALAACGSAPRQPENKEAQNYAARIGVAPTPTPAPMPVAAPSPGAAAVPVDTLSHGLFRGTMKDPEAAICGAPQMVAFMDRLADQPTRAAIAQTLGRTDNLRFVVIGSDAILPPDPASQRLSILIDSQGIIRDARCG